MYRLCKQIKIQEENDMKKTCNTFMDEYLSLDKGERLPGDLVFHLLTCPTCRAEVRALYRAEKAAGKPLSIPVPVTDKTITQVAKSIDPSFDPEKNKVPLLQWIISGVVMIAAMFFFGIYSSSASNHGLLVAFYLVFAGSVTAYCMLFVGTNIDFFVKKINSIKA